MPSAVVVAARRTPFAAAGRGLAGRDAPGLAAPVLGALVADLQSLFGSTAVDDVVLGCCCGPGGDVARVAALAAGLGDGVPGVSVDRQCGSGLEALRVAAALVGSGAADVVLAGGTESASAWSGRRAAFAPPGRPDPDMGPAADAVARVAWVSRERQDAYAARSHALTVTAAAGGVFDAELVAVDGVLRDDRPRRGLDVRALARFRPAFSADGTATAGNSCGHSDGAAAVALIASDMAAAQGVPGLRVLASAVVGVDPALPGLGAAPAVRAALARAGVRLEEVDVVEVTEAFAAQLLAASDALDLDPLGADAGRVCPDGGAIALGHPWAASGAALVVRLFSRLVRRDGGRYGVAACAIGGGQGIAVVVERVGP